MAKKPDKPEKRNKAKVDAETIEKLKKLGEDLISEINSGVSPSFEYPLRGRSNVLHDKVSGYLYLGDKKEKRTFLNISQAKKFMQTVAVAAKCKKFKEENLHTSIRGLFYQLKFTLGADMSEELFDEQSESNELVEDLEVALGVKREDLNLSTDRKGAVAGPMTIVDTFGGDTTRIDCTKQGRSGWMIPSDVDNGMDLVDVKAKYVLVIEKDAMWQRLNEDKFWKEENCIIITPKGQASRGCRRLIRRLADLGLPIYCFMDSDAWGWYIYWTIKTGSMNLAYLGSNIATPEAKFLGVTMSDLEEFPFLKKLTIRAKEVDIKRAQEMMTYPWIAQHPEWMKELQIVLDLKLKLEQDALQAKTLTFVGEYVRQKIKNKSFLP